MDHSWFRPAKRGTSVVEAGRVMDIRSGIFYWRSDPYLSNRCASMKGLLQLRITCYGIF